MGDIVEAKPNPYNELLNIVHQLKETDVLFKMFTITVYFSSLYFKFSSLYFKDVGFFLVLSFESIQINFVPQLLPCLYACENPSGYILINQDLILAF